MKFLAALLVFMIAVQPVQAGGCDMDAGSDSAAMAGMQHDMGGDSPNHSCCDEGGASLGPDCGDMARCGSCMMAAVAISPTISDDDAIGASAQKFLSDGGISPNHTYPPLPTPD